MVTDSGGSYSRWNDLDLSRWRSDTTLDAWGSFLYIRDTRSDALWAAASQADAAAESDLLRARESAAMLATARWMYRSGLARKESRGMHRRDDFPDQDDRQRHYTTTGGLDEVWTSVRPHAATVYAEAAE